MACCVVDRSQLEHEVEEDPVPFMRLGTRSEPAEGIYSKAPEVRLQFLNSSSIQGVLLFAEHTGACKRQGRRFGMVVLKSPHMTGSGPNHGTLDLCDSWISLCAQGVLASVDDFNPSKLLPNALMRSTCPATT